LRKHSDINRRLSPVRLLPPILLIAQAGWIIYVADRTDYTETPIFLLAALAFTALVLFPDVSRKAAPKKHDRLRIAQSMAVLLLVAAQIVFGIIAIRAAAYQRECRIIQIRSLFNGISRALACRVDQSNALPEGNFAAMADNVQQAGCFERVVIPFSGSDKNLAINRIPPRDPWDGQYFYQQISKNDYVLASSGPDLRFGTGDDIVADATTPYAFHGLQMLTYKKWKQNRR